MTLQAVGRDLRQESDAALEQTSGHPALPQEGLAGHTRSTGRGLAKRRTSVGAPLIGAAPVPRGLRTVGYLTALALWTVPILIPSGPGNTALPDLFMATALVMTTLWLYRYGAKVALPYSLGVGILMIAGLVAAVHQRASVAGLPVLQDLFLFLWAAGVANAVQRPWVLRVFLQAWCWSGIGAATVMVFAKLAGLGTLAGINPKNGGRAALTMNDPNMAANYFLCALLVLLATRVIRRRWIRLPGVVIILTAIVFTGSNGAGVSLIVALAVAGAVRIRKTRGPIVAIAVVGLLLVPVGAVAPYVNVNAIRATAANSVPLLQDSVGRSGESSSQRSLLVAEGMHLYFTGDLIGLGPGQVKATLANQGAPYVQEAHDDFVATLAERGVLGGIGLIFLIFSIGVRLTRVAVRPLPPDVAAMVPRPEYLLGLGCAFLVSACFYEVLHFRQLWVFLGLVAGLDMMVRGRWHR
jgi:O-antigen ligase